MSISKTQAASDTKHYIVCYPPERKLFKDKTKQKMNFVFKTCTFFLFLFNEKYMNIHTLFLYFLSTLFKHDEINAIAQATLTGN